MRIRSLSLENFRQFHGTQTMNFAQTDDRNVTLVFGANGSGKTTLLNAFTWALYKVFSPSFEDPDKLVNERAWFEAATGADVNARVIVEFEHERHVYTVTRVTTDRKGPSGERHRTRDGELSLSYTDPAGQHREEKQNPGDAINQILPQDLHRFFFFDGERIERLVKPDAYSEIAKAVKDILGLEIIERSIRHLSTTEKNLEVELGKVAPPEIAKITEDLTDLRARRQTAEDAKHLAEKNRAASEDELETINTDLRNSQEAKQLQERRDALEADLQANREEVRREAERLSLAFSRQGFLAFTDRLAHATLAVLESKRAKKEMPTPIKRQFVVDLLESGECICGTELKEGEGPYDRVAEWRNRAGLGDVEEAWTRLSANADEFIRLRPELYVEIKEIQAHRLRLLQAGMGIEEGLSEVKRQLELQPSQEVRGLEQRRTKLQESIRELTLQIGALGGDFDRYGLQIIEKEGELKRADLQNAQARLAQKRVQVARDARHVFDGILDIRSNDVRSQLDDRIKDTYSKISFKAYVPELTSDFRLRLTKTLGGEEESVAKSQGENQILSLSFVGAVAALARDRYAQAQREPSSVLSFQGGLYPVVMDSPFGSLDDNYRVQVARALPMLAPQVIVFVSKSQGLGPVQYELATRMGRMYVIAYFTPKDDAVNETIELKGRDLSYITKSPDQFEWAEIKEVE